MRRTQQIAFLGCSFSIGIFSAFNNFTLTLWLYGFTSSYLLLGLLGNSRSFEGTLVAPATGYWSDHVWLGWLGRRRPFILIGGLLSALLLALTPTVTHLPLPAILDWLPKGAPGLVQAVLIIFLFTLTFNAMGDIHDALLVDITSETERNWLSALRIVVSMAGQVAILVLGFFIWKSVVPDSAFATVGGLMAAGVLVTVLLVREPSPQAWAGRRIVPEARHAVPSQDEQGGMPLRVAVTHYRGAAIFCVVAFAYWSGVNAILPLISIYIRNILHATVGESQLLPAVLLLSTTIFALPAAKLGNRYGKRRVMSAGFLIIGLAGIGGLLITTKEQGAIVLLLAGLGNAGQQVLMVPLLADLVPRRHIGFATGILAGSGSVAAPFASLLAGSLADIYGPRIIFLFMTVTICVALALIPFVRPPADLEALDGADIPLRGQTDASTSL